jgi:saccharopepsin
MAGLGQKYMGQGSQEYNDRFSDTSMKPTAGHDVLVDNFLNAQCMFHGKAL